MLVLIPVEQLAVSAERIEQVEWLETVGLKVLAKKLWTGLRRDYGRALRPGNTCVDTFRSSFPIGHRSTDLIRSIAVKEASSRDRRTTREALIADGWEPCDFCGRPIKPGYQEVHAKTCRRRLEALAGDGAVPHQSQPPASERVGQQ